MGAVLCAAWYAAIMGECAAGRADAVDCLCDLDDLCVAAHGGALASSVDAGLLSDVCRVQRLAGDIMGAGDGVYRCIPCTALLLESFPCGSECQRL